MLLTAFLAASCLDVQVQQSELDRVDFSWYTFRSNPKPMPVATRADTNVMVGGSGVETHLPSGKSFGVFGYYHPQVSNSVAGGWKDLTHDNTPNLFYNEQVSISESAGVYSYSYVHSRYWPNNNRDRMSFIAYYPYYAGIATGLIDRNALVESFLDSHYEREGMVGFYYLVDPDPAKHVDFLVSDLCCDQSKALWDQNHSTGLTGTANGNVKFYFHHALSQIRIKNVSFDKSGNEDLELHVNYIMFNNVAVYGECIPEPDFSHKDANTGRTPVTPTWPVGGLSQVRPNLTSGVAAEICYDYTDPEHPEFLPEKALLMIPHTFFEGASVEVNFDVSRPMSAGGEHYEYESYTQTAQLRSAALELYGWEPGKIYTYNISLNLEKISINADVTDWLTAGDDVVFEN